MERRSSGSTRASHAISLSSTPPIAAAMRCRRRRARLKDKLAKLDAEMVRLTRSTREMLAHRPADLAHRSRHPLYGDERARYGRRWLQRAGRRRYRASSDRRARGDQRRRTDRHLLANMAEQARDEMGVEKLEAVADRGYYEGNEIRACEEAGITVTLPKPMTSGAKAAGRFGKQDFVYLPDEDVYRCPAGERLIFRFAGEEGGKLTRRYWTRGCQTCVLKAKCTTGPERRVSRWEHEAVLDAVQAATRSQPRQNDRAPADCRTPVWHHQGLDGRDALPHDDAAESGDRDGAQRARLQHEAGNRDCGRRRVDGGNAGAKDDQRGQIGCCQRPQDATGAITGPTSPF